MTTYLYNIPYPVQSCVSLYRKYMASKVDFLFLANRVIQDVGSQKFSYMDVFESFTIPSGMPDTTQFFCVGGRISNTDPGKAKIEVFVTDETGRQLDGGYALLQGDTKGGNLLLGAQFSFVKFTKAGKYLIKVKYNDKYIEGGNGEWSFPVFKPV